MAHTFQISELPVETRYLREPQPWHSHRGTSTKLSGTRIYSSKATTLGGTSPLFDAFSWAFNSHLPLEIGPDAVWLTCLNGLAHHIDTDPEKYRSAFVSHEGKKLLEVTVEARPMNPNPSAGWDGLDKGVMENIVSMFSSLLKDWLNQNRHKLVVCDFSTTTRTDKLASEVSLMGAMKHYFDYKAHLACGFTQITVLGTPADWQDIINRAHALEELGLEWWTKSLIPVLQEFKKSCEGSPDLDFWQRSYLKHRIGSGGEFSVSGWVNVFYPYITTKGTEEVQPNPFVAWESNDTRGLESEDFPFGLSKVPVVINDHGQIYNCEFYGGLVGVFKDEDHTVRPVSGYSLQLLSKD